VFAGVVIQPKLTRHRHVGDVIVSVLSAGLARLVSDVGGYRRSSC
jgi:hypothetical protein